jgi:hypothetical protein
MSQCDEFNSVTLAGAWLQALYRLQRCAYDKQCSIYYCGNALPVPVSIISSSIAVLKQRFARVSPRRHRHMVWVDLHCAKCATTTISTSSTSTTSVSSVSASRQWLLSKPVRICLFVRRQLRVSPVAAATALRLLLMALLLLLLLALRCQLSARSSAAAWHRLLSHLLCMNTDKE